ncbi:MAG: PadR family transcriptional regulator [Actinomycetota bacterium]|nr:PadR family transcriptional regulator [Actinomycetota bacterium]
MLELAILGLLKEKTMHGYELKKQLNQKLGHFWQVSLGSLYPTLNRLSERGAIEAIFSGEDTPRRKNVYRITECGEQEFLKLIDDRATTQWEEEKFPLRFAFFRYVKPEIRIRLLERRKAYLHDKLDDLRASLREAHDRIDSYTLSLMRHGLDSTASDIAWLDELIVAERRLLAGEPGAEPTSPTADEHENSAEGRGERHRRETLTTPEGPAPKPPDGATPTATRSTSIRAAARGRS